MTGRPPGQNPIRGPQSALTDYLASNNISARRIQNDYDQRFRAAQYEAAQRRAEAAQHQAEAAENEGENANEDEGNEENGGDELRQSRQRKRKQKATLDKIKKSKENQRRKARRVGDSVEDDFIKSRCPGQFDNCELCGKRFTVTAYSKTGPIGCLLCSVCSKEKADEEKKEKPKKSGPAKRARRQAQSNLLDGFVQRGAPSLLDMCIRKIADNIHDIEEFGALPDALMVRLSMILSKRRALTPRTLQLFLTPENDAIELFDCAKLNEEDFHQIFAIMPNLTKVIIHVANQLKDEVMEYMIDRQTKVKHIELDTTNLISDEVWRKLFRERGAALEILKLSNLDNSLDDETMEVLASHCPNIHTLELTEVWKPGEGTLDAIATMEKLEHLTLDFIKDTKPENLVSLIEKRGSKLRTLALHGFRESDDTFLDMVRDKCKVLEEFCFNQNAVCTDRGFVSLFTGWANRPLTSIDLSSDRCLDNANPEGPDEPIGLASEGFRALMKHSGKNLEKLDIHSCRHVTHEAFVDVFGEGTRYPKLKELDVSFHPIMDDYLMGLIFQSCPALTKVVAFGCFGIRHVRIPAGVALIGAVAAHESVAVEGEFLNTLSQALFPTG